MNNGRIFPRNLTSIENELLLSILPEKKTGYKKYRDKINTLVVTGAGRFGGGNFVLGRKGTGPDLSLPSTPVFAVGTNIYMEGTIDITLHEDINDEIEFDISARNRELLPQKLTGIKKWNYSEWNPGSKAPGDNSVVREIIIVKNEYLLVVAPKHKKIWLHEYKSGVNFLIPLTNFYNELMRVCNVVDSSVALKPALFFKNLDNFRDEELMLAFLSYNRYLKKMNIEDSVPISSVQKKKGIFSIFRKG